MDYYGYNSTSRRTVILRIVAVAFLGIVIIYALFWLIFFRHSGDTTTKKTASTSTSQQSPQGTSGSSDKTTATAPKATTTTPAQISDESSNSGDSTNEGTDRLVDTGPGDIIAIFFLTTLLASTGYELKHRMRS